jgi:hypothetical protein
MLMVNQLTGFGARRVAAGGGGYTPPPGTGWIGLWDASVLAGLTLSGSNITAVADQSGTGNDMGPYSTAPTYNATGFNTSYPAMIFASSTGLKKSSFAFGTGNTLTVFFVGTMNSGTTAFGRAISYFAGGANDADNNASFLLSRDNTNNGVTLYRNGNQAIRAMTTGTPHRVIATISSSGVETIYVDGVATTGATLNAAFGASGTLAIGLAAFGITSAWDGAISDVGIATVFTNSTDVASLDSYLQTKWGL